MSDLQNAKKYAVRRKRHSIWRNVVTCFAAVVVFCTTYALILPAITMEFSCGKEEHVHADGCYTLSCGLEQTPGHFHDESCYDEEGKLICEQEEPQSHAHTQECYAPVASTCGMEEAAGHTHAEQCYALPKVLTCTQPEQTAHTHDPTACYTQQTSITCGLEEGEEHTHTDACHTASSVLTCTLPETEGHAHTDACYVLGETPELICTQEETAGHTHTEECYPADAQPELLCGKEELTVHKHTDECYTLVCVLEEHTHTNECQVKKDEIPVEESVPEEAALVQMNAAPRASQSFSGYIVQGSQKAETGYNAATQNYTTDVSFQYKINKEQLEATDGKFYIDLKNDVLVNYAERYDIISKTSGSEKKTGVFYFITVGEGEQAHPQMVIEFDPNSIAGVADNGIVRGEMHFKGTVDKTHADDQGNLSFDITDNLHVDVDSSKIGKDNSEIKKYDISTTKAVGTPVITDADPVTGTPGKAALNYTVTVGTSNEDGKQGTPGQVIVKDNLEWSQQDGTPLKDCAMTGMTIVKVDASGNKSQVSAAPNTSADGSKREWDLTLPKLEKGEHYEITYGYEYTFGVDDKVSVDLTNNKVNTESRIPGGRPEEVVTGQAEQTVPQIKPPSGDPSLGKTGEENPASQKINWTVTYNANGKLIGGDGKSVTITDTMFAEGSDFSVTQNGQPLQYSPTGNQITIQTPTSSTAPIVITYTTSAADLNKWSSGETPNVVGNEASYVGRLGDTIKTEASVSKAGGGVSKNHGAVVDDGEKLTIPWTVTITPGADGIPAGKVFSDIVEGNPKPSFDQGSFTVSYADENGNVLGAVSESGYSTPSYNTNYQWNQEQVSFTFNENPFADGKAPAEAKKIVVSYNTITQNNNENTYKNTTDVDGKKAEDEAYYKPAWVEPHKTHGNIVVGETGLSIPWTVQYKTDAKVIEELTDDLAIEGGGDHYYDTSTVKLIIQKNDGSPAEVIPSDAYTLTFSGGTDGKPTNLQYKFKEPGYPLPNNLQYIQLTYTTKTDSVPEVHTDYKNIAKAFNKKVEDTAPYDPPGTDVEKTHGDHTADMSADTLTIPWRVKIDIHDGKINTPITDSLRTAENGKNHYFLESSAPVLKVLKEDGSVAATISPDDYTVTYYSDYTDTPESGANAAQAEPGKNTYMVIKFNNTPYLISADGHKTLQLEYATVGPLPDQAETFRNQVWVNGKRAEDTDNFEPTKPKPSKSVGQVEQLGNGVRIPWTVKVERGQLPLTQIEEVAYFNKNYLPEAASHYFDTSTIQLQFLDAAGNVLDVDGETSKLPGYTTTLYTDCWQSGDFYASSVDKIGEPAMFMQMNFTDGDAFANAPEGTKYLQLTYKTYNNDVTAEQSNTFKNLVYVSGQKEEAKTSITKVEKKVEKNKDNWVSEQVDAGENKEGTLHRWQVRAITSADRSFLTITDVLPQYVTLEELMIGAGSNQNDLQDWYNFKPVGNSFSANTNKYSVSGSYGVNAEGRYVVDVTFRKLDGSSILAGECFDIYLTPKVDVDSLPESLRAKQITLDNQAHVTHDGGGAPSNVSSQTWTDGRDDIAAGSLGKGKYLEKGGKLNYAVDINPEGKDLEPEGNSFVLIDTLSYNSKEFNVTKTPVDAECTGYDIRLDTSDANKIKVFKAQVDKDGKAILDDKGKMIKGEELSPSRWAMTLDTQEEGDNVSKIIRLTVPDGIPLIMSYTYNVVPRMDPASASTSLLEFEFDASNTVMMYGHKRVEASDNHTLNNWQSTSGGGSSGTGVNTLVLKKVDASNNALMLPGAQFTISERQADGSWKPVKTLQTDKGGVLEIDNFGIDVNNEDEWRKYNTLYKVVETAPPSGYAMPYAPEEFLFYFSSGTGTQLSADLTNGATDLSKVSNVAWVENTSMQASFKVEKIWEDSSGKPITGSQNVDFELIQYRSTTRPSSEVTDPMVSMRDVELTITGHGAEKKVSLKTTKGSMLRLTVTNNNPNNDWAKSPTFNPEIPGLRQEVVETVPNPWNANETFVKTVRYEFPVYDVSKSTIGFNASANDLQVTLTPAGGSNTGGGVSGAVEATGKSWTITLTPGEGYNWSSDSFDIDSGQDGKQPLPFTEDVDGTTYYYTYLVQEQESTGAYDVTYSNVDGGGNLVGVSSGTIRVVNTRKENPPISLPNTGGIGTTVFTLAGLALTGGAGLGLCKTSRSKEKRKRGTSEKE